MEAPRGIQNQKKSDKISDLKPIEESRNILMRGRTDVAKLVEAPLVQACETFYDMNIRTLASSCNAKDISAGHAHIIIDFDSMSGANKEIARAISEPIPYDGMQAVKISIPIASDSSIADVQQAANEIASRFQQQPATWIPTYSLEQMRAIYGIPPEEPLKPDDFAEEGGYVWDPEKQVFYPSEELRLKAST